MEIIPPKPIPIPDDATAVNLWMFSDDDFHRKDCTPAVLPVRSLGRRERSRRTASSNSGLETKRVAPLLALAVDCRSNGVSRSEGL